MILERLLQYLPEMRNVGGVRVIPYMQVRYLTAGKFSQEMCKCTVIAKNMINNGMYNNFCL